jgi:signal transduction protein with GAF and PtsI domain
MASHESEMMWTIDEISQLITQRGNASETLQDVVHLVQHRFHTDVCSAYLLEPDRANLVLAATVGLRPESGSRRRTAASAVRRRCHHSPAVQVLQRSR